MLTKEQFINDVVDDWFREKDQPFMVDRKFMWRIVEDTVQAFTLSKITPDIKETAYRLLWSEIDKMGIYPQSIRVPEGSEYKGYEKRTEFMEGWNTALIEIVRRLAVVETLKEEEK
jgi:hypothetical protein